MTNLINFCILHCSLPSEWEQVGLTPVFKGGLTQAKQTTAPSHYINFAVFEKVIFSQTWSAFHKVLCSNLSGFMKSHSCCTVRTILFLVIFRNESYLQKMTRNSIDNQEAVAAVAVDLSKAFDAINHSLLLAKLQAYGFSTQALKLMSTYLLGR